MRKYPPYVNCIPSKGRLYYYFRRGEIRIALPDPTSPEFENSYKLALIAAKGDPLPKRRITRDLRSFQRKLGVYLLIKNGAVIYVGSSQDMEHRVAAHRMNGREFDKAFFIGTATVDEALELEANPDPSDTSECEPSDTVSGPRETQHRVAVNG